MYWVSAREGLLALLLSGAGPVMGEEESAEGVECPEPPHWVRTDMPSNKTKSG
jgi:hypothetical protein